MTKSSAQKCYDLLQKVIEIIEEQQEKDQEKMEALQEKADNRDSGEMTDKEQEKYDAMESQGYALEEHHDTITDLCDFFESVANKD